jgi:hypothetical protein
MNERGNRIEEEYREVARELHHRLGRAAAEYAERQPALGLTHEGTFNPQSGIGSLPVRHVTARRTCADGSKWVVIIGFGMRPLVAKVYPAMWEEAIDWSVMTRRPPLSIPVCAQWAGRDHYDRPRFSDVVLNPIVVDGSSVRWEGRQWPRIAEVDARWIIESIFARTLLHDSAEAAEAAQRDGRWIRMSTEPYAKGGQGCVWQVKDREDPEGPRYALKELRWPSSATGAMYRRFVNEIEIIKGLSHPNIVPVVDCFIPGENGGTQPFYVTPWTDTTMKEAKWLAGEVRAVLQIGVEIASALCAADAKGVTHRDVKPANILLRLNPLVALLADFGIALVRDEEERLTATRGATVGSDEFAPPEAHGGRLDEVDSRFDVYSLGKTLSAALAGGEVFPGWHWDDARYDLRHRPGAEADVALQHFYGVLRRMVAERREDRFLSIAACHAALMRALDAVTRFVPYREGMYDGPLSPTEVHLRLEALYASQEPAQAWIQVRDLIDDAIAASERAIQAAESHCDAAAAREASEYLLAVLLPVVEQGDERGLDRLLVELWQHADDPTGRGRGDAEGSVRRAARAIGFYGATTLAWANERWLALDRLAKQHAKYPDWLLHLDLCAGAAEATWDFLEASLEASAIVRAVAPRIADRGAAWRQQAAGILALHFAYQAPAAERVHVFRDRIFPACLSGEWMNGLARRLQQDRALEKQFVGQIFVLAYVPAFTDFCREITPAILRSIGDSRVVRRRDPVVFPGEIDVWMRWCGWTDDHAAQPAGLSVR